MRDLWTIFWKEWKEMLLQGGTSSLLASRMPDRAILLGKVAAIVAYGWGILLMNLLVSAVVVNVAHRQGRLAVYPPGLLAAVVFIGLFFCIFGAAAGVLISLRAKTVRQAQQILTLSSVALPAGIAFLLQKVLVGLFQSFSPEQVALFIVAAFVLADIVLLALALARFQRSRLILS